MRIRLLVDGPKALIMVRPRNELLGRVLIPKARGYGWSRSPGVTPCHWLDVELPARPWPLAVNISLPGVDYPAVSRVLNTGRVERVRAWWTGELMEFDMRSSFEEYYENWQARR